MSFCSDAVARTSLFPSFATNPCLSVSIKSSAFKHVQVGEASRSIAACSRVAFLALEELTSELFDARAICLRCGFGGLTAHHSQSSLGSVATMKDSSASSVSGKRCLISVVHVLADTMVESRWERGFERLSRQGIRQLPTQLRVFVRSPRCRTMCDCPCEDFTYPCTTSQAIFANGANTLVAFPAGRTSAGSNCSGACVLNRRRCGFFVLYGRRVRDFAFVAAVRLCSLAKAMLTLELVTVPLRLGDCNAKRLEGTLGAWRTSEFDSSGTASAFSISRLNEIQDRSWTRSCVGGLDGTTLCMGCEQFPRGGNRENALPFYPGKGLHWMEKLCQLERCAWCETILRMEPS